MAIHIEIKDDQINDLINFYLTKQKGIRDQILKLEIDLKDVNATIAQLKQRPVKIKDSFDVSLRPDAEVFSPKWPWLKKIAYAIKEAGKPVTTKEIIETLELYEPKTEEERKRVLSSVSSTLSVKSGKYSERKPFVKGLSESGEFTFDIWQEEQNTEETSRQYGSRIVMDDLPF
jgi:hypothetical protein